MSNYRQPTTIAFDAATAPTNPNALNDEFAASRPGILNQPGFAVLDPKWHTWDPGGVLTFKAIDVRRQMLLLRSNGDKQWCGIMQNLPLPAVGHTVDCTIYARVAFADIDTVDAFSPISAGIVLGRDLVGAPDTSFFGTVELGALKQDMGGGVLSSQGAAACQTYAGFDVPGTPYAEIPYVTDGYMRLRLRQALAAGPVWSVDVFAEFSISGGIGWLPMTDALSGSVPYRQVALGVRSVAGNEVGHYFDFFRVDVADIDSNASTTGDTQTLGAV